MSRFLLRGTHVWLLALAGAVVGHSERAVAGTLYSQPWDGSTNAYASQNDPNSFGNFATTYDNFTLGGDSRVNNVAWTGEYFNGAPAPISGFTLNFYSNNAGVPGSLVATDTITGNANETPVDVVNQIYAYNADITPFSLTAGQEYWLSIVPTLGFPPQWGWATGTGGDGAGYQVNFGSGGSIPNDLAFTLSGTPTPEPGTLALAGLAGIFGGVVWVKRRR